MIPSQCMALSNVISLGLGAFPLIREHRCKYTYDMYTVSKLSQTDTALLYSSANVSVWRPQTGVGIHFSTTVSWGPQLLPSHKSLRRAGQKCGQTGPAWLCACKVIFISGEHSTRGLFPCAEVDSVMAPKALSGQIHSQGYESIFPAHMASAR